MVNNYFKVCSATGEYHFCFNDLDIHAMAQAFAFARDVAECNQPGTVSLFRAPLNEGPWDEYPLIGHRHRNDIENDLVDCESPDEAVRLAQEMFALNHEYRFRPVALKAVA